MSICVDSPLMVVVDYADCFFITITCVSDMDIIS